MAGQYAWVGITVGVFLAGLLVGYAVFGVVYAGDSANFGEKEDLVPVATEMTSQDVDPRLYMQQQSPDVLAEEVVRDELAIKALMNNTEFQRMLIEHMKENHQLTQNTILAMMEEPELRVHLIGHMWENEEFLNEVRGLLEQDPATGPDGHSME